MKKMKIGSYFTLTCIAFFCIGCKSMSDEPQSPAELEVAEGTWVVEYNFHDDDNAYFAGNYMDWCKAHKDKLVLSMPSFELPYPNFKEAHHLIWREYVTNPTYEELEQRKIAFEANFKRPDKIFPTYQTNCRIYKFNPEYTGPWRIIFYEAFYSHNTDNADFMEWLTESQAKRINPIFYQGGSWIGTNCAYGGMQIKEYYKHFPYGVFLWEETVEDASETEVKAMVERFKSFTQIISGTVYDVFEAHYSPLNIQEFQTQTNPN